MQITNTLNSNLLVCGEISSPTFSSALNSHADSFDRLKVSNPFTLFCSHSQNGALDELQWSSTGTGTSTLNTTENVYYLSVNTGKRFVKQSKMYVPYQPGRSNFVVITGVLTDAYVTGLISRIGSFDNHTDKTSPQANDVGGDGHFIQLIGSQLPVVQRHTISTPPYYSDLVVNQLSWNLDKLNGTGPSKITLDPTKANAYIFERALGAVGKVRCGIIYDGVPIYYHVFHNINMNPSTFMKNASLPIRYEIDATNAVTNASIMKFIGSAVLSDGSLGFEGRTFSVSLGISGKSVGTSVVPLISLRVGSNNIRNIIDIINYNICSASKNYTRIFLVYNGTLTNAVWNSVNTYSGAEYDIAATAISGGLIYQEEFFAGSNNVKGYGSRSDQSKIFIAANIQGVSDVITICGQLTSGTAIVYASLNYLEIE